MFSHAHPLEVWRQQLDALPYEFFLGRLGDRSGALVVVVVERVCDVSSVVGGKSVDVKEREREEGNGEIGGFLFICVEGE